MEIKTRKDVYGSFYWAEIWIVRECYFAQGQTAEEATQKLKDHLKEIIPIYENDIWVAQEKIKEINKFLAQDLVSL